MWFGTACLIASVSIAAACPVCLVYRCPDRAPVLNAMAQTAATRNATVLIVVTPNVRVLISAIPNAMVQIVVTRNEKVLISATPNVMVQTSGLRNATVQIVLVQNVVTPNVMAVRHCRVATVLKAVHSAAHCEVPQSVAVAHYVAVAPRYVAEVVRYVAEVGRCVELQPGPAAYSAVELRRSASGPRFGAPVEPVQCVRDRASAFHLSLNSQAVQRELVSIHRHSKLRALYAPAVVRSQLDFEFHRHRGLSFHAVFAQAA
jgi:hypothetical protein